jgi:hypothetical protein
VTYTYRSAGASQQQADHNRQKLSQGLLTYRRDITSLTARIKALRQQAENGVAQAIWDDVPLKTAAIAAGITVVKAASVRLEFEDLPHSGTSPESHVVSLRALNQQATSLEAERKKLRQQQEQLVVVALTTGLLDAPWVAKVSGLTLERVAALANERAALIPAPVVGAVDVELLVDRTEGFSPDVPARIAGLSFLDEVAKRNILGETARKVFNL